MQKSKYFIFIVLFILFFSCKKYDENGNEIKDYNQIKKMEWILGEWVNNDSTGTFIEIWEKDTDSSYAAVSYFIQEKDTVHSEKIQIIENEEKLLLNTTTKGQHHNQPMIFLRTNEDENNKKFVFENPKNDYPQKIEYRLVNTSQFVVSILGKEKNLKVKESYPFKRVIPKNNNKY